MQNALPNDIDSNFIDRLGPLTGATYAAIITGAGAATTLACALPQSNVGKNLNLAVQPIFSQSQHQPRHGLADVWTKPLDTSSSITLTNQII